MTLARQHSELGFSLAALPEGTSQLHWLDAAEDVRDCSEEVLAGALASQTLFLAGPAADPVPVSASAGAVASLSQPGVYILEAVVVDDAGASTSSAVVVGYESHRAGKPSDEPAPALSIWVWLGPVIAVCMALVIVAAAVVFRRRRNAGPRRQTLSMARRQSIAIAGVNPMGRKGAGRTPPGVNPMMQLGQHGASKRKRTFRRSSIALDESTIAGVNPMRSPGRRMSLASQSSTESTSHLRGMGTFRGAGAVARRGSITAVRTVSSGSTTSSAGKPHMGIRRLSRRGSLLVGTNPMVSANLAAAAAAAQRRQTAAEAGSHGPTSRPRAKTPQHTRHKHAESIDSRLEEEGGFAGSNPMSFRQGSQRAGARGKRQSTTAVRVRRTSSVESADQPMEGRYLRALTFTRPAAARRPVHSRVDEAQSADRRSVDLTDAKRAVPAARTKVSSMRLRRGTRMMGNITSGVLAKQVAETSTGLGLGGLERRSSRPRTQRRKGITAPLRQLQSPRR